MGKLESQRKGCLKSVFNLAYLFPVGVIVAWNLWSLQDYSHWWERFSHYFSLSLILVIYFCISALLATVAVFIANIFTPPYKNVRSTWIVPVLGSFFYSSIYIISNGIRLFAHCNNYSGSTRYECALMFGSDLIWIILIAFVLLMPMSLFSFWLGIFVKKIVRKIFKMQ